MCGWYDAQLLEVLASRRAGGGGGGEGDEVIPGGIGRWVGQQVLGGVGEQGKGGLSVCFLREWEYVNAGEVP